MLSQAEFMVSIGLFLFYIGIGGGTAALAFHVLPKRAKQKVMSLLGVEDYSS